MKNLLLTLGVLVSGSLSSFSQTERGAYFSFQATPTDDPTTAVYQEGVSTSTLVGTPLFSASGSGFSASGSGNYGANFTPFDDSTWVPGKSAAWNTLRGSSNNSWQVTLNTTDLASLTARFTYRLNGVESNGVPFNRLTAFEYKVGSGSWLVVPNANLALENNGSWNNLWTADLSGLAALENEPEVTLRWSLPSLDLAEDNRIRVDNLQITGTFAVVPDPLQWVTPSDLPENSLGNSYAVSLEVSGGTGPYSYALKSGTSLPSGLSLSVAGELRGEPSTAGNYTFMVTATDSGNSASSIDQQFSFTVSEPSTVGAYFAFQTSASDTGEDANTYDEAVSVSSWPSLPTFSARGSRLTNFRNYGPPTQFEAFDGSGWAPGRGVAWNTATASSLDNAWQITFSTIDLSELMVSFVYRLNGTESGGALLTNLAAFEYQIGSGEFLPVPGADLSLANNGKYDNQWSADLREIAAIENEAKVTLRWVLPDLDAVSGTQIRMDNLQIEGVNNLLSGGLVMETASDLAQTRMKDNYDITIEVSGGKGPYLYGLENGSALPPGMSLNPSTGVLSGSPSLAGSYDFVVTVSDSSEPPQMVESEFVLEVKRQRFLPEGNYNVLFIAVDDLKPNFEPFTRAPFGAQPLGPEYPAPIMPHLADLAADSVTFDNAHCQQPTCWISRVCTLTGLRPDKTKNWDINTQFRQMNPDVVTLPQHFSEQGYITTGYGKIFDKRSTPSNDVQDGVRSWPRKQIASDGSTHGGLTDGNYTHSFYQDGHWQAERDYVAAEYTNSSGKTIPRTALFATDRAEINYWENPPRPVENNDYTDGIIATRSIVELEALAANYRSTGEAFFLAVGFKKPHLPMVAPSVYWDLYDPAEIDLTGYDGTRTLPVGAPSWSGPYNEPASYGDINNGDGLNSGPIKVEDARRLIWGYLAAASFMDAQVGRVMTALEASGVADNTIVVFWGDHGWQLGDHNGFWAKHTLFEQSTRVPLIIKSPGMRELGTAGKITSAMAELVDIFPTLVDLANLPLPSQPAGLEFQGKSLLPLLEDPEQPWKTGAISQYQRRISGPGRSGNGMGYTIRTQWFRYTEWWRTQTSTPAEGGGYSDRDVKLYSTPEFGELYDMVNDPGETNNVAMDSSYAEVRVEMAALLDGGGGWIQESVAPPTNYPVEYSDWKSSFSTPGILPQDLAESADPDNDTLINLMEYVHGTDPFSPNADPVSFGVINGEGGLALALKYPVISSRVDVLTSAETSVDLFNWNFQGVTTENLGGSGYKTIYESSIPMLKGQERRGMLRLKIEK